MNNVIKKDSIIPPLVDASQIFTTQLFKKLKEKIDASVYVAINDDTLLVRINKGAISYKFELPNFCVMVVSGLNTTKLTSIIVEDYKCFLMRIFFYDCRRKEDD